MALSAANKIASGDEANQDSYNTASLGVTSGRLYLLVVRAVKSGGGTPAIPTVTGASQTWTYVTSNVNGADSTDRVSLFRCVANATTSGALTIDFGGQTQTFAKWAVDEITGAAQGNNGAAAIVQSTTGDSNGSSVTSFNLTLSAFASASNAVWACMFVAAATTVTHEAGYTELSDNAVTGAGKGQTQFKATSDTSPSWTTSSGVVQGAIAVEITADVSVSAQNVSATVAANTAGNTVAPTLTTAIALTAAALDATVSYEPPPRSLLVDNVELTGYAQWSDFSLTECANRGEVGTGGIDFFDAASSLTIPALKSLVLNEPAAQAGPLAYSGFVHDRQSTPLRDADLAAKMWGVETTDLNILAYDFILTDAEGADRPAETDYVRVAWLLTSALNSVGGVGVGYVPNSDTVTMEATDYRGKTPAELLAQCSEAAGKMWFVYDYGDGPKLFYALATDSALPADIAIADDGTADGSTIFAPIGEPTVKRSPDRIYSGIRLTYNGGVVEVSDPDVATAYRTREISVLDTSITDETLATVKAQALLDGAATEITEIEGLELLLPAVNLNDIRAGQLVDIILAREGIDASYRITSRTITPTGTADDPYYFVSLGLASDVLASAHGARGTYEVWEHTSNATDDGATVVVDRSGINVIDGAITVVNSGATVIIDGESNMFKIAATGTSSVSSFTAPNQSTTDVDVATGFTYRPASLTYLETGSNSSLISGSRVIVAGDGLSILDHFNAQVSVVNTDETRVHVQVQSYRPSGTIGPYGFRYYFMIEQSI